jgi:type I restriction enzyme S subunit
MQEKYKSMSNVPNLRFPEFTGEWEVKKLGEITSWSSGGTPPKDNPLFWNGDIPWISASSMRGIVYSDSELKITNVGLIKGSKLARKGTLLILVRGSMLFNKIPIGIVSKDVAFNQDVKSIVVNDYSTSEYILNWFIAFEPKILNMVTGTGIGAGKLDLLDLKALEIKIPFRHEQQKIASFFSLIHERIQTQSKIIGELKVLKSTVSKKLFSQQLRFKDEGGNGFPDWEVKKLGECLDYIQPTKYLVSSTEYDNSYKTPVLTAGKTFILGYTNETNGIFENNLPIIIFDDFTTATQFVDFPFKAKSSAMKILAATKGVHIKFIFEAMQFMNYEIGGHERHWISKFAPIEILVPSHDEQTKIANFLSQIDEKIEIEKQLLSQYENQKKYLLQNLFI